ncbi:hypothetical protein [Phenylobacterium sp.]|uniref:hypothetical protein n=1 Tax=Phenylobacterium sp. TaxID=1871053 RepID=UPI00289ECC45|nr:hypothetical protein [Phenylobacterium sp.]
MIWVRTTAVLAGAGLLATGAQAQPAQQVTGPVATYWMSAQTLTGFGAMGAGGGRPSMGAMMGAMMGGGSNVSKSLTLQLGTSRTASGAPAAEHLPPSALRAGESLPLLSPKAPGPVRETPYAMPEGYKPKGRMLIYWGCGEHAGPGQPVVIDFAKVAAGQVPAGLQSLAATFGSPMQPPAPGRSTTYGEWPNEKTRTTVPGNGSLVGDHLIRGNYTPDIKFALAAEQDFLGPLNLTRNLVNPSGSGQLAWNALGNARGYLAVAMGASADETVVLWSSSQVQASAFALPDYLSNGDIQRLVASKALMAPTTTSCTIPVEVVKAAPQAMVQLAAYGGETNISYPPRPADPKTAWNIDWTLKVRYKSQTGGMLGMQTPGAMGMADDDADGGDQRGDPQGQGGQKSKSPFGAPGVGGTILKGLGGRLPGL